MGVMVHNKVATFLWSTVYIHTPSSCWVQRSPE